MSRVPWSVVVNKTSYVSLALAATVALAVAIAFNMPSLLFLAMALNFLMALVAYTGAAH